MSLFIIVVFVGSFRKHPSKMSLHYRKNHSCLDAYKELAHTKRKIQSVHLNEKCTFLSLPLKSHLAPGVAILVCFREMERRFFFPLLLDICLWSGKREEHEFTLPVHFNSNNETVNK